LGGGERLVHGEFLDGDTPAEQLVGGPPHHTHATAPEPLLQPVTARDDTGVVPSVSVARRPLGPHAPIMPHRMCPLRYGDSAKRGTSVQVRHAGAGGVCPAQMPDAMWYRRGRGRGELGRATGSVLPPCRVRACPLPSALAPPLEHRLELGPG